MVAGLADEVLGRGTNGMELVDVPSRMGDLRHSGQIQP